jgi:ABC-type phosphate/phosphonate transport system substrate-binding protein
MSRWTWSGVGAAAALAGLLAASPQAPADGDVRPPAVRVGLISSLFGDAPEPVVQIAMRPFKSILEAQTGAVGQIVPGGDADSLGRQLKDGQLQLAVFQGVEFAWARLKQPALKPVLVAVNQGRAVRADLVVLKDGKASCCEDLRGQAVALPRLSRQHCLLFLERHCVPSGSTPEQCFARVTAPGSAEDALDDVVDGAVQAAVIDDADLEAYQKDKPARAAKLKALMQSEPFPCAVLVIASYPGALDERLLERFRAGMIDAKSTDRGRQFLKLCRVAGFEAPPADLEQTLADIARAYPPPAE